METALLREVLVADDPDLWRRVGFEVGTADCAAVGETTLRFVAPASAGRAGGGVIGWSVDALRGELDGLPDPEAEPDARGPRESRHRNGATGIDHIVVLTPDRERTAAAIEEGGLDVLRRREAAHPVPGRQAFFRLGGVILEVLEPDPPGNRDASARIAGLAFTVANLDRVAAQLGSDLGRIRPAVQTGRDIAPVRRRAGLAVAVAFITPGVAADGRWSGPRPP